MANTIDMKGQSLTAQMIDDFISTMDWSPIIKPVFVSPRDAYLLNVVLPQVDHEMPWSAAPPMRYVKSKKWRLRKNKPHYNYFRKRTERVRELMREREKQEDTRKMFDLQSRCFLTEDHLGDFSAIHELLPNDKRDWGPR